MLLKQGSMRRGEAVAVVGALVFVGGVAEADTICVPDDHDTIQGALDATFDGDEVCVAPGTYNEAINFIGKAVRLYSTDGPEVTIIDATGVDASVVVCVSGEGPNTILEGFTITGGTGSDGPGGLVGGGMRCDGSSPTVTNCTISGNSADEGGGVYCYNSRPTLTNCTISGNGVTYNGTGSGVYCYSSNPTLTNCTISGNSSSGGSEGGGIACLEYSSPTLTNCTISGNSAWHGGGIYCVDRSHPTLTRCTISGNSNRGIYCRDRSSPTLTRCTISGNSGGGIFCYSHGDPTLTNCTISGNSGRGISCLHSRPTLTNCTISGNSDRGISCRVGSYPTLTNCTISGNSHAGVYCDESWPTITNCILWGDATGEIVIESGSPVVTYCNVQGGWPGEGNIDTDPQFAFADDFHLAAGSPCIDAGTNDPVGGLPADDLDGNPRPLDGDGDAFAVADMGVFEFNPAAPSIALSPTVFEFTASEGGDDPADQLLSLRNCGGGTLNWEITGQPAWLTVSPSAGESDGEVDPVTLHVDVTGLAHGEYYALSEITDPQAVNSPREFVVTLYVIGTLHVPDEYPTIQAALDAALDGDVVEVADGTYTGPGNKDLDFGGKAITVRSASGDPTSCVIDCEGNGGGFYFHSGEGPDSIVEGLTIMNGSADGIYCNRSSPTLTRCTISGNSGHGISCNSSSPTLTNCTISGNEATHGGGVYCSYGFPTLKNCTIIGNVAGNGGGVCCYDDSSPTLTNCTISGNEAESGGGVYCYDSSVTLTNCTITGNTAARGGGFFGDGYGNTTLVNCILWGDTPEEINVESSEPVVTYCDVQGGWPGEGNIDADPLCDADGRPQAGSPCIDAGVNNALPADTLDLDHDGDTSERLPLDLDGNPRFADDLDTEDTGCGPVVVDMGAYEFQGEPMHPVLIGDVDGDGVVDFADILDVLMAWGECDPECCLADQDFNWQVDFEDMLLVLANWS